MPATRTDDVPAREYFFRRGKKRSALEATGAISHVISEEGIAPFVKRNELAGIFVCPADEWHAGVPELPQAAFQEGRQFGCVPNFTVLPSRFQSPAMGEAAGGKRGIGQLP